MSTVIIASVLSGAHIDRRVAVADPSDPTIKRTGRLQSVKHDRYGVYVEMALDDGGFWAKTIHENASVAVPDADG